MPVCVVISEAKEAAALTRWAVHFAHGEECELIVLDVTGQSGTSRVREKCDPESFRKVPHTDKDALLAAPSLHSAWKAMDEVCGEMGQMGEIWPRVELWTCRGSCSPNCIVEFASRHDTTLLVSGVHQTDHPLAEPLFKAAPWRTVLIRLGGSDGQKCKQVLVPCAGGRHSRAALRLAKGLCLSNQGCMHPLYVEPNLDEPEIVKEVGGTHP